MKKVCMSLATFFFVLAMVPSVWAEVTATPVSGVVPLDVDFTITVIDDTEPYEFEWDFGDSTTSTDQNPAHTYTSPGVYSVQVTVTDDEGNKTVGSVVISVQSDTSVCGTHAVFDSSAKILTVPYLDVPLIDPISQQEIPGSEAVFFCTMKYVNHSGGSFSIKNVTYLPGESGDDCHAEYKYDGTISIPNVDVTTVIVLPWGNIIEGPVETYQVTLKQLMLDNTYFHLESALITSGSSVQPTTTDQPMLSGPSNGLQSTDITITIDNYSNNALYAITVDDGIYVQNDDTIIWTLPAVSVDTEFNIKVTAQENGQSVSQITTHSLIVKNSIAYTANLCTDSSRSFADYYYSDNSPDKAFDGNKNAMNNNGESWYRHGTAHGPLPGYLGYDFGSGNEKKIEKYVLYNVTTYCADQFPSDWQLQGSNDSTNGLDGSWDIVDSRSDQTAEFGEGKEYSFNNYNQYRWYRLKIFKSTHLANDQAVQLAEFEMMEILD